MTASQQQRRWWERVGQRFGATRLGGWMLLNVTTYTDPLLMRLTKGRIHTGILGGMPCALLTTIGAKSGLERTVPLAAIRDGQNIVLIASNAGSERHPAWYHNLCAHPEATLYLNGSTGSYVAREALGEERERLWAKAAGMLVGYEIYQQRATNRQIPVMILEPK